MANKVKAIPTINTKAKNCITTAEFYISIDKKKASHKDSPNSLKSNLSLIRRYHLLVMQSQ